MTDLIIPPKVDSAVVPLEEMLRRQRMHQQAMEDEARRSEQRKRDRRNFVDFPVSEFPCDGGKRKTAQEWREFFSYRGSSMMPAPALYAAVRDMMSSTSKTVFHDEWLSRLQSDFSGGLLVGSRLGGGIQGPVVMCYHGKKSPRCIPALPRYSSALVSEVLRTTDGLMVFRSLFDTDDAAQRVEEVWNRICNAPAYDSCISLPSAKNWPKEHMLVMRICSQQRAQEVDKPVIHIRFVDERSDNHKGRSYEVYHG